ncbi:MAG: hypothetical protein IKT40_12425 [Bacilli bacterium]|nr:hypothetical protein [Bacilli bacterium]
MEEKYPLIYNVIENIRLLSIRLKKEGKLLYNDEYAKIINDNFEYNDDIIKEVINLTLDVSKMSIDDLKADFNCYFKKSMSYKNCRADNIDDIVNFIRNRIQTTHRLLSTPIDLFFPWVLTIHGHTYYSKLNQKVSVAIGLKEAKLGRKNNFYYLK